MGVTDHADVVAAGIGPGDLVITTPFSFVASSNCLLYVGATPVFVDVEPVWESRMAALRQHTSQGRDHPDMEPFFRRITRELGEKGGYAYAEGFRRLPPT